MDKYSAKSILLLGVLFDGGGKLLFYLSNRYIIIILGNFFGGGGSRGNSGSRQSFYRENLISQRIYS